MNWFGEGLGEIRDFVWSQRDSRFCVETEPIAAELNFSKSKPNWWFGYDSGFQFLKSKVYGSGSDLIQKRDLTEPCSSLDQTSIHCH